MKDFYQKIRKIIEVHNQQVQGVFPEAGECGTGFYYTIGNAERDLPELLLIGSLPPEIGTLVLNQLGQLMRDQGKPFEEGLVDIDWSFPFKIRKAGARAKSDYTIQAGQYLERETYDVLQVLICDREGRYPGDEGCTMEVDLP